jgi:hypothetical protein
MKKSITLLQTCLTVALLSGGSAVFRAEANPTLPRHLSPELRVGDSWNYSDGLKITFVQVASDTRRYPNRPAPRVQKVRGDAVVVLTLEAGNQAPKTVRLHTNGEPKVAVIAANELPDGMVGIPRSYLVSIRKLLPATATPAGRRPQRLYRLRLKVDEAV